MNRFIASTKTLVPARFYQALPSQLVQTGFKFWLRWIGGTVAGFIVSLLFIEIGVRPYLGAMEGIAGGLMIGVAQWLVLRRQMRSVHGWIVANLLCWTIIGGSSLGAIGWIAPRTNQLLIRVIYGGFDGALVGALLGLGQWLVLKRRVYGSGWWVLISSAGWSIGLMLGWFFGGVLYLATHLFLAEVIGLGITWFVVSAITGLGLIWLWKRSAG